MAYVTAVTNRAASDIVARNSKAFMNVADFTRIYGNAQLVSGLVAALSGSPVAFGLLATPTITSIPTVEDFNTLTGNIEAARLIAIDQFAPIPGALTEIKDDYQAGASYPTFNYLDVNLWESTLDAIWDYLDGALLEVCPTLIANLTVLTGATKIYVDCLNASTFDIDLQGTAELYIL